MRVADICLYGHLHIPDAWKGKEEPLWILDPLVNPVVWIHECLYAKIEIADSNFKVEYYTRDHELFPELTKEFSRW